MLISDEYKEMNSQLHETRNDYGVGGHRWGSTLLDLCKSMNTVDVLDYGCGKGTLQRSMPTLNVFNYDPAIPGFDEEPDAHDLVICTDVLEHVEPDCLDDVLDHIAEKTNLTAFLNIATRPAVKTLADGRNAHLIQEPFEWWFPKLAERFEILTLNVVPGSEFTVVLHQRGMPMVVPKRDKVAV
jgi:2-polyprenyl-3-methyl-5-hydroxy-6-metoxy-1,4-benzoquinol methylase